MLVKVENHGRLQNERKKSKWNNGKGNLHGKCIWQLGYYDRLGELEK